MRKRIQSDERTCFQEAAPYNPRTDSMADVAIVYGVNPTFEERVERWQQAGYRIHVMTGVAWGSYEDYVRGQWDGVQHYDDAQTAADDFKLEHGISQGRDIFYMMPSHTYARYLGEKLRRVVDAGVIAIHLEEPEFWVRAGYGAGFQREWVEFYGEPWQDPVSSPDARYRASKLMHHLYTRTLAYLFPELKKYAKEKGLKEFQCYVPTHSLINYAHWRIVSPESRLLTIPECDGVIGQVWTGTSRTANIYQGERRQRTFEAGYCEYAACAALVRGTKKKLWQLADPIEDDPNYCWEDYRQNWECTVIGSLLVTESERFEIMPWPSRIFMHSYPTVNLKNIPLKELLTVYLSRLEAAGKTGLAADTFRAFELYKDFYIEAGEESRKETFGFSGMADRAEEERFGDVWAVVNGFYKHLSFWEDQTDAQKIRNALSTFYHDPTSQRAFIPASYATELQTIYNALADMAWPDDMEWLHGQDGVGLAISDTLMYQRGDPGASDPDMSSLYGLALPLVKHGTALIMVQLEQAARPGYLDNIGVLLLSYEGQKPLSPDTHTALADWVRLGRALVIFGNGDAYNGVREWWNQDNNTGGASYKSPQEHLTELLGLGRQPSVGLHQAGKGVVIVVPDSPAALAHNPQGAEVVVAAAHAARTSLGLPWHEGSVLALRRGPYVAAVGMDETVYNQPVTLPGTYVNLFDAGLKVYTDPLIQPDTRWLFYDLARCPAHPWVIASAGRLNDEAYTAANLTFNIAGMTKTICAVRAHLPTHPASVTVDGQPMAFEWDATSSTVLLQFPNRCEGVAVAVNW